MSFGSKGSGADDDRVPGGGVGRAWDARLEEWGNVLRELGGLPPILQAAVGLDAWNELAVLQHAPWLGRLLVASMLRRAGVTTAAHLAAFNLGLKSIPVDRRHRDRETRLAAILAGIIVAAEIGLKEHDRLGLARQMMERRLIGRRTSSKLPGLIELVTRPLVSAGMVAKELGVTQRAALRIVEELGLRPLPARPGLAPIAEIDWSARGYEGTKLGYLIGQAGYFHDGHRAVDDCFALLEVLTRETSGEMRTAFAELYQASQQARVRVFAENSPFDMKDHLKSRGYRWSDGSDGRPKSWWIEVDEDALDNEFHYLSDMSSS